MAIDKEVMWILDTTTGQVYSESINRLAKEQENTVRTMDYSKQAFQHYRKASSILSGALSQGTRSGPTIIASLNTLGFEADGSNKTMQNIRNVVMVNYTFLMLYKAYAAVLEASTAKESALAAIETSLAAAAQQWHAIAMAGGAAAMVAGSFAVGYQVGRGKWKLRKDPRTPMGRREMQAHLAVYQGGMT